ncbi:MAG: hypothetical protein QNJ69_00525 [Gammaproteobacteria bacterium]|nr:hypothetical protein [Gammaproteobacteria bacterium]
MKSIFTCCRWLAATALAAGVMLQLSCSDPITDAGSTANGPDPGVLEAPIAYVKRPIPVDEDDEEIESDLREPLFFGEGGDVYIRSNSTVTATEINITSAVTGGQGDVKDLKPSFDGKKLLFTLRLFDPNPNDDDTPSWNIYEYDLENDVLRRIIQNELTAEAGDDIAPSYLPDGRIIFSSNRQRQSSEILTNEGKPRFKALDEDEDTPAMTLHIMNDDGGELQQVSFNQSHDLDPTILTNNFSGEVLFTRWDNAGGNNGMHLYKMTPDGTDVQVLYGVHSHNTGATNDGNNNATIQFSQAEEMEDGRILVIARPYSNTFGGGDIVLIDIENYLNNTQPVDSLSSSQGPAQASATINQISTRGSNNEFSLGGRYSAAWPLWDGSNRLLVSKSTCELDINDEHFPCIEPHLSDPNAVEASPEYNLWLYDMDDHAEKIILLGEDGMVFTDVVAIQSRAVTPTIIPAKTIGELDVGWRDDGIGAIHIRSVYDFGNGSFNGCFLNDCTSATGISSVTELGDPANADAAERPARFVRFVKPVSLPDEDDPDLGNLAPDLAREAFGPQRNQDMREIVGYAPVEPDGSVKVKLPANIPLAISVLDSMGRRIGPRHQNWFTVRPGDTLECTGCHTETTQNGAIPFAHHRRDAEAASINSGLQNLSFGNTQIPGTVDEYWGNMGETMAEARFRLAETSIPPMGALVSAIEPQVTMNLVYEDYWTDPTVRTPDTAFSYEYANLTTTMPFRNPSVAANCQDPDDWDFTCRAVINYEQHIHPLWSAPRGVADADTCTNCHNDTDEVLMVAMVPAAQLDLSDGGSDQNNGIQYKSYRELFASDAGQIVDMDGNLVNDTIQVPVDADGDGIQDVDVNGDPIFDTIDNPNAATTPVMSGNSARASYFVQKMSSATATRNASLGPGDAGYIDHSGFMSGDELRLIIEWLDIGAQYFNDPFDPAVPMN